MVKTELEGRTMTCPKCKRTHVFPYNLIFIDEKVNYQTRQRSHKRGHSRGAHKGELAKIN